MDWGNVSFCLPMNVPGTREELNSQTMATLIARDVFVSRGGLEEIIERRYAKMSDNRWIDPHASTWNQDGADVINTSGRCDARLPVSRELVNSSDPRVQRLFEFANFGLDLPTWIQPNENIQHRVMIITQDPKRVDDGAGVVTLSSPFGLHSPSVRCGRIGERMTAIVEMLHDRHCAVYLTDVRKFFVDGGRNGSRIINSCSDIFDRCLGRELSLFLPTHILAFGEKASKLLRGNQDNDWRGIQQLSERFAHHCDCSQFTALYHLSPQNCGRIPAGVNPASYYCECVREACHL